MPMILLANSFFLRNDPKQLQRMKSYPPLATLLVAAALRSRGHAVALFDATFATGVDDFVAMLDATRPAMVGILEDNFNYLTKMCTVATRQATLSMVAARCGRWSRLCVGVELRRASTYGKEWWHDRVHESARHAPKESALSAVDHGRGSGATAWRRLADR
jgi:hypothetical protein